MTTSWQGRKALITGGAGFLGATLAHRLVALGAEVTAIDSFLPEGGANPFNLEGVPERATLKESSGGFTLVKGDIGDAGVMTPLVERASAIFNLAGRTGHMDSMSDPMGDLAANVTAQVGLLELARARNPAVRIVYASTRQFYGVPDYLPVDEKHALRPPDVNGVHKLAAEQHHLIYAKVHGLAATALRLTNCYGPRMRVKDARQTFVGIWIRRLLEDQPFEVWGGAQKRDFTYADDVADAFIAAIDAPACSGNAYNLGGAHQNGSGAVSLDELAAALIAANGGKGSVTRMEFPVDRKRIDIGDYEADDRAFRAATSWAPRVALVDGLRRSIAFYRANLSHYI